MEINETNCRLVDTVLHCCHPLATVVDEHTREPLAVMAEVEAAVPVLLDVRILGILGPELQATFRTPADVLFQVLK